MQQTVGGASARAFSPGLVVALCFGIAALEGYDIQAFGVTAGRIKDALGLDPAQLGNVGSIAMIGLIIGAMGGGWVADRVGRKPVLLASVIMFGAFSVATGLADGYEPILITRLLTGIGFGGAMPNLIAIASEISTPERRVATTTTMFCGMPVGGAAVSLLMLTYGKELDWRTVFFIGGALPLLLAPAIWFLLPETKPEHAAHLDRNLVKALFGHGRAPTTLLLWVSFVLTLVVLYLLLNWLPLLVTGKGLSESDGSSAALTFNLASIPGALLMGFIVDRAGFRWPLLVCYLGLAGAMYALGLSTAVSPVLIFTGIGGFLLLGANYSLYGLAPALYPPHVRAAASGAAVAVGRVGSVLGPWVAGQLRGNGFSAGDVFSTMIPVVVVAGIAVLIVTSIGKLNPET